MHSVVIGHPILICGTLLPDPRNLQWGGCASPYFEIERGVVTSKFPFVQNLPRVPESQTRPHLHKLLKQPFSPHHSTFYSSTFQQLQNIPITLHNVNQAYQSNLNTHITSPLNQHVWIR